MVQKFSQVYEIDYIKTFIPIIRRELLKIFLSIVAILGMILIRIDVVKVYLKSALSQNKKSIYIKISQGCLAIQKRLVCKLLKSLYGLNQAKRV